MYGIRLFDVEISFAFAEDLVFERSIECSEGDIVVDAV